MYVRIKRVPATDEKLAARYGDSLQVAMNEANDFLLYSVPSSFASNSEVFLSPADVLLEAIELAKAGDSRCLDLSSQLVDNVIEQVRGSIQNLYQQARREQAEKRSRNNA